jgi:hypothetical protein
MEWRGNYFWVSGRWAHSSRRRSNRFGRSRCLWRWAKRNPWGGVQEFWRIRGWSGIWTRLRRRLQSCGGAFAGIGGGAFVSNAKSTGDLKGAFDTYSFNVGVGAIKVSLQFGYSGGTWIGSATFGPGIGISGSSYPTNTWPGLLPGPLAQVAMTNLAQVIAGIV